MVLLNNLELKDMVEVPKGKIWRTFTAAQGLGSRMLGFRVSVKNLEVKDMVAVPKGIYVQQQCFKPRLRQPPDSPALHQACLGF
jgi:hypothetical protein